MTRQVRTRDSPNARGRSIFLDAGGGLNLVTIVQGV
jgi:hypothetical protein